MKNKILIIFSLVIAFLIIQQVYLFYKYSGNLIINISNYTYIESAEGQTLSYDLYIDDEFFAEDSISNVGFDAFERYSFRGLFGKYKVKIVFEDGVYHEVFVNIFFVKFLVIEIYRKEEMMTDSESTNYYMIQSYTQSRPIRFE